VTAGQAPGGCTSGEPSLAHANLQHWLDFFCSSAVTEASLGVIQPLTAEEACGFLGCMVVETGEPELENLDVMEAGSGAGRGAMQYTGVRRTAYDAARLQAISEGIDPNSNGWQEQYFAEEYAGLHDPPEGSLIGWTRVFEDRPSCMDPAAAAAYWTGSAAEAEGYFRPGTPHTERRQAEALQGLGVAAERRAGAAAHWGLIAGEEHQCKPTQHPGRPSRRSICGSGRWMAALSGRSAPARWSSCRAALIPPSSCCWPCWVEQRCRAWTADAWSAGGGLAPGLSSLRPVLRPRLRWDRSRRCAALGADHHGHALICRFSVLQARGGSIPAAGVLRQSHRIILRGHAGRPLRRTWIDRPYGEEEISRLEEEVLPAIQQCLARVDEIDSALEAEAQLSYRQQVEAEAALRGGGLQCSGCMPAV
jgi:hypothetical protein